MEMTDTNRHRHLSNFSNQNQNSCDTWASIIRNNLSENLSCKCVVGTIYGALNFLVGIAMIVIGIQYSKKCKIEELITYLQVLGGIMVTMSIIWSTMACVSSVFYQNSTGDRFVQ